MHLRSDKTLASSSQASTRVSSHESKTVPQKQLSASREEPLSSSDSELTRLSGSKYSIPMEPFISFDDDMSASLSFNVKIIYVRENDLGAKIYMDPDSHYVVKIAPPSSRTPSEVMVRFMGSHYVSPMGTIYILTQFYELMDSMGEIHENEDEVNSHRTFTEPNKLERLVGSSGAAPSAPPFKTMSRGKAKEIDEETKASMHSRHETILNKLQVVKLVTTYMR